MPSPQGRLREGEWKYRRKWPLRLNSNVERRLEQEQALSGEDDGFSSVSDAWDGRAREASCFDAAPVGVRSGEG